MKQIALITGATSGIGKACAEILAKNSYDLIITGRRNERLRELSDQLVKKFGIKTLPLAFDVRDRDIVAQHLGDLPNEWKNIDVLINNAGLAAGVDPIQQGNVDDWDRMIDTNVKGLLYVSRVIIPGMGERKRGHIVNIASIAGKEVYPNGNVYCASKYAVDALSKGMRIDLLNDGIKVTNIAPGMVETEFSEVRLHGDLTAAKNVYKGFEPLRAEDIADTIWFAVSRPAHVQIADVLILPAAQASATNVKRDV